MMWECKDGTEIDIKNMSDSHLSNTLKMLLRNSTKENFTYVGSPSDIDCFYVDTLEPEEYLLQSGYYELLQEFQSRKIKNTLNKNKKYVLRSKRKINCQVGRTSNY